MSRRRHRRWTPGKGFTKVYDWGTEAGWIRAERDGCTVALYRTIYHYCDDYDNRCPRYGAWDYSEAWTIRLPRGSWCYDELLNKPRRIIRNAMEHSHREDPRFAATIVSYQHVGPASHGYEKRHGMRFFSNGGRFHRQSFRRINRNRLNSMRLKEAMRPHYRTHILMNIFDEEWNAQHGES